MSPEELNVSGKSDKQPLLAKVDKKHSVVLTIHSLCLFRSLFTVYFWSFLNVYCYVFCNCQKVLYRYFSTPSDLHFTTLTAFKTSINPFYLMHIHRFSFCVYFTVLVVVVCVLAFLL